MIQYKFWMVASDKPIIRSTDSGIWRRILPQPKRIKFDWSDALLSSNYPGFARRILQYKKSQAVHNPTMKEFIRREKK